MLGNHLFYFLKCNCLRKTSISLISFDVEAINLPLTHLSILMNGGEALKFQTVNFLGLIKANHLIKVSMDIIIIRLFFFLLKERLHITLN